MIIIVKIISVVILLIVLVKVVVCDLGGMFVIVLVVEKFMVRNIYCIKYEVIFLLIFFK